MHYMSRSAPHSPCMRHTHVYVHTTTPLPPPSWDIRTCTYTPQPPSLSLHETHARVRTHHNPPHSPCMRHTHVYVHTTTPQTSLHKPQAVYVRSRGRRHSRSGVVPTAGVAVTVGRESAEAAAGDDPWVHPDRKLDGWLLPGMDREVVSLDITKLRTTWRCVNQN